MATFSLKIVQKIPTGIENAWSFFSDAANLQTITPPDLGFVIISNLIREKMYPGQIIEYYVKPVLGIRIYWMTEITHVREKLFFVDEQRFGPYQFWHHQHHFRVIEGGIEMTDIIHYRVLFGFLGKWANRFFVARQLRKIFDFRFKKIEDLFGIWEEEENLAEIYD